jgi:Domain of unknown function (DUF4136)
MIGGYRGARKPASWQVFSSLVTEKENYTMKRIRLTGLLCFGVLAMAQNVHFDYDRSADFSAYKTYQWVDLQSGRVTNQLMDQNIKRAVDEQLVLKGLKRVESGGEVQIAYQAALHRKRQFDGFGAGPRWFGPARVTSSTIEIGKLVVDIFDPARKQLVWRSAAQKTLDMKKDPDKNYRNLQKAMARLFKDYPPGNAKN